MSDNTLKLQINITKAAMHLHARIWSPPPGFSRPIYNGAFFQRAAQILLVNIDAHLDEDMRTTLTTALHSSTDTLERLSQQADQVVLIHADMHDGNVVYGGQPREAGVIDSERCGFGCWALDVAMAMHYLTDGLAQSLLGAYVSHAPLSSEAEDALPCLLSQPKQRHQQAPFSTVSIQITL